MRKKRTVYLDHAATTPIDKKVLKGMIPYLEEQFGNAGALYSLGREARRALNIARQDVASVLGTKPENIIFTGSGTESDNLAIFGVAKQYKEEGRHIIVSKIEHKAVLEPARALEREGYEITYLNVDKNGVVDLEALKSALRDDTILVSIMYANNEVGTIEPLNKIAKIIKEHRNKSGKNFPFFHTDACQAAGAVSLSVSNLGVDLLTLNGSKIYGPKGAGCLYVSGGVRLCPLIVGGSQENRMRAGTENVASIVGLSIALTIAEAKREEESVRESALRDYFMSEVEKRIERVTLNGYQKKRLPNNINLFFEGVEGESVLLMLDSEGISVSTGSACTAKELAPSHVLSAMGFTDSHTYGSVRFTLGRSTTKKDVDYVLKKLPPIIAKLRQLAVT